MLIALHGIFVEAVVGVATLDVLANGLVVGDDVTGC